MYREPLNHKGSMAECMDDLTVRNPRHRGGGANATKVFLQPSGRELSQLRTHIGGQWYGVDRSCRRYGPAGPVDHRLVRPAWGWWWSGRCGAGGGEGVRGWWWSGCAEVAGTLGRREFTRQGARVRPLSLTLTSPLALRQAYG